MKTFKELLKTKDFESMTNRQLSKALNKLCGVKTGAFTYHRINWMDERKEDWMVYCNQAGMTDFQIRQYHHDGRYDDTATIMFEVRRNAFLWLLEVEKLN